MTSCKRESIIGSPLPFKIYHEQSLNTNSVIEELADDFRTGVYVHCNFMQRARLASRLAGFRLYLLRQASVRCCYDLATARKRVVRDI